MATTTTHEARRDTANRKRHSSNPSGKSVRLMTWVGGLVVVIGAIGFGATQLLQSFGGQTTTVLSTYRVEPVELLVTVTEDGNVESASNVDIKCQVAGGSSILWLIEDGRVVKKGDKLVELDSAALEDEINSQRIVYNKAKSAVIQAKTAVSVAKIAVKEYLEGTFKKELQDAETQITIAEENLRSAKNALEYSERMFQRGYISTLELEGQQFAVKRADLELQSAQTAKEVLEKFTKVKTLEDLNSQVETAEATLESENAAFELEEAKLRRLETQLENCTIFAPQDGMAVYANEQGGRFGQQNATIEEGAAVRDRQTILRLPDLAHMQVKVKVHETKVEQLQVNMRARINIQGREFQGLVTSIANQPEATSFFQGNVKEYATAVKIDGQPEGLRPGMTAEVEILVAHLKDVLALPVSAVVEQRSEFYCWVSDNGVIDRRKLTLGVNNEQFVEVTSGIKAGEQVVRNPRAVIDEARKDEVEREEVDVQEKFGDTSGSPEGALRGGGPGGAEPSGTGGGGPGRGGPGGGRGRMDFTQFDADGDGNLSQDELPEPMRPMFERMDSNGDGLLDKQELDAIRRQAGGRSGRSGGNLMRFDQDGDGKVSLDEAPEFMQSFFDRLDADGDGFVDQQEASAAESRFRAGGGSGGPGGGFGGPGRGP